MALKAYSLIRTNRKGVTEPCYVTCIKQISDYENKTIIIQFRCFGGIEEEKRKVILIQNELPTPIESEILSLILPEQDFLIEAMTPFTLDGQGLPKVLVLSEDIWNLAKTKPFISDFATIDEDGNRVEVLKSLNDLNATLHEIELN